MIEPIAPNLVAQFVTRAAERGGTPFLWAKRDGRWQATSWAEAARQVAALAAALQALGLACGDRVMLISENRPEWAIADLAIMAAGCVTVPAYTSYTTADHAHVAADSGARAAIVSTAKLGAIVLPALVRGGACAHAIGIEPLPADAAGTIRLHHWPALLARHADAPAGPAPDLASDDLACIIYTSGTGGLPRGVRQHHGAIQHNVAAARAVIVEDFPRDEREVMLSLLPLSHAYEHTAGLHMPIALGAEIYYADGLEKLAATIAEVRPTLMIVVPRLFELLRARMLKQLGEQGRLARWLTARALALDARPRRRAVDRPLDWVLERTVRARVRQRFGGRLKALVSGGAPLNASVGGFFRALGLTLLQGYGQTEAGPVVSCNRPRFGIRLDTVGPPLDGVEVRIAADGEILVRGPNVMHGYWNNPAETARVLVDGWLHTGDVGHLDDGGRIVITDRKKDLIVNDKGDNVSPQRVEGLLTLEPEIAQAMVVGDRRPYLVGLVVPAADWRAQVAEAEVPRLLTAAVDRVNRGLSSTEKVRRILVADEPFTIENGALTPSLKVRRHVLRARYGAALDALYLGART